MNKTSIHKTRLVFPVAALFMSALLHWGCEEATGSMDPGVKGDASHSLRVHSPNGGESFKPGDEVEVRFRADEGTHYLVNVEWSWNGGQSWQMLTTEESVQLEGKATYTFEVPAEVSVSRFENGELVHSRFSTVSDSCLVRIYEYTQNDINDISDKYFSVKAP